MLRQAGETQTNMEFYEDQKGQNLPAQSQQKSLARGRHDISHVPKSGERNFQGNMS
jgi:hypothetical protein